MAGAEGASKGSGRSEAVNNFAAWEMIMVDKVGQEPVELDLGKEGTHRSTTNVHRRSLDDFNHTFEWAGRVFIRNESSDEEPVRGLAQ
jgi:hypothetical protein